jgi:hypothetical protein
MMRPLVKDLKEVNSSLFIADYGCGDSQYPESAESLLRERAKKHIQEYKEIINS